ERRPILKLLEVLETRVHLPNGQHHVTGESKSVDDVVRARLRRRDVRSGLVRRLPLIVADDSELEAQRLEQRERLRERIVEIEGVTGMNSGALLLGVEFVHLEGGECRRLVLRQVERLAARDGGRPVTGPDVVVGARAESACGRQESVDGANVGAWLPPGENQRLIVRVGQSLSRAEFST